MFAMPIKCFVLMESLMRILWSWCGTTTLPRIRTIHCLVLSLTADPMVLMCTPKDYTQGGLWPLKTLWTFFRAKIWVESVRVRWLIVDPMTDNWTFAHSKTSFFLFTNIHTLYFRCIHKLFLTNSDFMFSHTMLRIILHNTLFLLVWFTHKVRCIGGKKNNL